MVPKFCFINDCERPHKARGYCLPHYKSLGINAIPHEGWATTPVRERLWAQVDRRGAGECWHWTGAVNDQGYGNIGLGRRHEGKARVHRLSYELTIGAIPEGAQVDHTCHNNTDCPGGPDCLHRRCCNPAHLEAVTQQANIARGNAGKYQNAKTHCPQGHEYTPENTFNNNSGRGCKVCRLAWNRKYNAKRKAS